MCRRLAIPGNLAVRGNELCARSSGPHGWVPDKSQPQISPTKKYLGHSSKEKRSLVGFTIVNEDLRRTRGAILMKMADLLKENAYSVDFLKDNGGDLDENV